MGGGTRNGGGGISSSPGVPGITGVPGRTGVPGSPGVPGRTGAPVVGGIDRFGGGCCVLLINVVIPIFSAAPLVNLLPAKNDGGGWLRVYSKLSVSAAFVVDSNGLK